MSNSSKVIILMWSVVGAAFGLLNALTFGMAGLLITVPVCLGLGWFVGTYTHRRDHHRGL